MSTTTQWDAIAIGAGPAGAAAAAILAEHGHRVLVLEREKFPRYHVGESLLPFTYYPLQRLGLLEKMRQSAFVKKYSVQFVSTSGKASQVLRSEFDQMVMEHAREKGAIIKEEVTVTGLLREGEKVTGVRTEAKD